MLKRTLLPRSAWRNSSFPVSLGENAVSNPPPIAHPVRNELPDAGLSDSKPSHRLALGSGRGPSRGLPSVDVREMFFLKSIQMVKGQVCIGLRAVLELLAPPPSRHDHSDGGIPRQSGQRFEQAFHTRCRKSVEPIRPVECQRRDAHRRGLAIEVRWFGNK